MPFPAAKREYKVLRSEVEKFAKEIHGVDGLQKQKDEHRLKVVKREINSLKRKLKKLEKERDQLVEGLNS